MSPVAPTRVRRTEDVRRLGSTRLLPVLPVLNLDVMRTARLDGAVTSTTLVDSVVSLEVELTMTGASVLSLGIEDRDWSLLRSRVLRDVVNLDLGDPRLGRLRYWTMDRRRRIGDVSVQGTTTTIRFWARDDAALKTASGSLAAARARTDLAAFVSLLCREIRGTTQLTPLVPRPGLVPEIDTQTTSTRRGRAGRFSPGAESDLTVKGAGAKTEQLRVANQLLLEAREQDAKAKATLALVVTGIVESQLQNLPDGDRDSRGALQVRDGTAKALGISNRNVRESAEAFLLKGFWGKGGAIALARDNPTRSAGWVAQQVQGSGHPTRYDQYLDEAREIVEAWNSGGTADPEEQPRRAEWTRGTSKTVESSWTALGRIAQEIGRRRFTTLGQLVMARDQDLILAVPHVTLIPDDEVLVQRPSIDGVMTTLELQVLADGWSDPPGGVADLAAGQWGPADGPWLVQTIRSLGGDDLLTVTLTQPATTTPASSTTRKDSSTSSSSGNGDGVESALRWARQQVGVREQPPGSNRGPVVDQIIRKGGGAPGLPWCGYFCAAALKEGGIDAPAWIGSTEKIYVNAKARRAPFKGTTSIEHARPGDLALIGPPGPNGHVGFVERVSGGNVHTIDGNTSQMCARRTYGPAQVTAIAQVRWPS